MIDAVTRGWRDSNGALMFGWDYLMKKFIANDESHPEEKSYHMDTFANYEDLRIVVGHITTVGTHSIALGMILMQEHFIVEKEELVKDPINSKVLLSIRKRSRTKFEAKSSMFDPKRTQSDVIDKLACTVDKITQAIESIDTRQHNCWYIIKEIPDLDDNDRFKVLDLLNTKAKKSEFLNMTSEEH
ncbi:uncharacterized protein At2g29880-like [Olea europaea var. sylvestris]|uniref:uncharacterized protein At2g29880-like n=1 Tax=Olea europaea var. sylvestris TaxID=158386 RepID=UPI000C1CCC3B|nr:uncharacterized protein At2g29880-like [Olea europaea var. sylvestris]